MGTKVQYKSYLPGYYCTRDLNEDAAHGWPLYYEDAVAGGQFYNTFNPRLVNEYTDYDKETLKQTMLNHEAIFRKQVHELHRLYRKQRELMEEFKQKEECHYAVPSHSSLPSSSSLHTLTKNTEKMQAVPRLWEIDCNHSSQSVSGREFPEPLKILNNESKQAGGILTEGGGSLKKSDLDSKLSKQPRVMIDLQLPADVYIDSEMEKTDEGHCALPFFGVVESPSLNCDLEPGKGLKLTLGCSGISSRGESWQKTSRLQDARSSESLSDLNNPIPINGISHGASSTFLSNYLQWKVPHEETHGHKSSLPLNSSFLNKKNFQDQHQNAGSSLLEQRSFGNESGRSTNIFVPSFSDKNMLEPHRPERSNFEESCDLSSFLMSKRMKESEIKDKPTGSNELFGTCLGSTSYSALPSPMPSGPCARIALSGRVSVPSPFDSSQMKPMHGTLFAPIDVDTFPLFKESMPLNQASNSNKSIFLSGCASDKFLFNRSLTSSRSFGGEVSSYPNGFPHDMNYMSCSNFPPINANKASHDYGVMSSQGNSGVNGSKECLMRSGNKVVKPLENVDLNLDLSKDCPNEFPFRQEPVLKEPESKNLNSLGGLPWFRSSPFSKQTNKILNSMIPPIDFSAQDVGRTERERFPSLDSTWPAVKNSKPSDCSSGKNILGVDTTHQDGLRLLDSSCRNDIIDLEKPASVESSLGDGVQNNVHSQRDQINLNFMPCNTQKLGHEIDLETPAIPDVDDVDLCCKETLELDQISLPVEIQICEPDSKEDSERAQDGASRAAEIIVTMSSNMCRNLGSAGSCQLDSTSAESLMWFADMICSNVDDLRDMCGMSNGDVNESSDSDGIDFFESMTLKLAETKPEDYWIKPPEREVVNNGEASFASLLIGKPKRGQARKRRQKRDFQKDILPGLASLSRHEATEDLQTIGGLLRASGQPWEMGLTRRNAGRSGTSRSRGGRRARGGASAATKFKASPAPTTLPNNAELVINETYIMGWGKTRRCRRARCPSGNVIPLLPRE